MRTKIIITGSMVFGLAANVAMASYCAIFARGKQCDYVTYEECVRTAGSHGACEINPREAEGPPGTAPFCLVTQSGRKCIYDDAPACQFAAAIQNSEIVKRAEYVANPNQ